MRMFDNRLPQFGEYLGEGVTLPNTATEVLAGNPSRISGAAGGTGVNVRCASSVTIPAGKKLQLVVKDCETTDGTFKEVCRVTFYEGMYNAASHLGEAVLPSQTKKFVTAELVADGACVGSVDVYPYATR